VAVSTKVSGIVALADGGGGRHAPFGHEEALSDSNRKLVECGPKTVRRRLM
jgi:hypothetical protein